MELRAFAEHVLHATTLADKLACPETITDEHPGPALDAPPEPGRPRELRFKPADVRREGFPSLHHLERLEERGRLLHFFANHELLATELMALVLLRFPDAPPAFRRGVLQTLKDEQEHTRLYVERMAACGIRFGDLPVSGYFWRAVAPMTSPLDYVAGLSLTFEQANLDFARDFAGRFAAVEDLDSARLLERIYHDEIAHVAYGLKWFRRWKSPDLSDWAAFCQQLKFPLSPQRAKGFTVNAEGRLAAGLEPGFIAELEVFSRSKGRTPNVYLFNPLAEASVVRGRALTPTALQRRLIRDLANLPQFLARPDDLVLVPQRPRVEFLAALRHAGLPLPEFIECPADADVAERIGPRKLGQLRPWAWAPDSVERLGPLLAQTTGESRTPEACYRPEWGRLYSKAVSAELLAELLAARPSHRDGSARWGDEEWLCGPEDVGVHVVSLDGALRAIAAIRAGGHHRVVAKQAVGVAGANALRLWEPELLEPQRRWLAKAAATPAGLVIEPWLERVFDFSIQWEMRPDGFKLLGFAGLQNDLRGQYQGNWIGPHFDRRPPPPIAALLGTPRDVGTRVLAFYETVRARLGPRLAAMGYRGPLGIDAFVFRDPSGRCRLKPVVEINPRYTMGRLALELMRYVCPGSHGILRLIPVAMSDRDGRPSATRIAQAWTAAHPPVLEGAPIPRLRSGTICLNDPAAAEVVLARWEVHPSLDGFPPLAPAPPSAPPR